MPKFVDLTAITGAATASGDLLVIEDVSANETKKITRNELASALAASASAVSYLGYNTIGGSNEVITNRRIYLKKITAPSNGILLNIAAHIKPDTGDHVQQLAVAVYEDSTGTPAKLLAANMNPATSTLLESVAATPVYRWFATPIGFEVSAGDFWIAVQVINGAGAGSIAYDGSGTDKYFTASGDYLLDAGGTSYSTALSTSSNKYSIRAAFLPTA